MEWPIQIVIALFFLFGLISNLIPVLPATLIIFIGILFYHLFSPDSLLSLTFICVMGGLVILSQALDFIASYWGAKKFGASRLGAIGAILGGILGALFFNIPGIILGPFVGAVAFELIHQRPHKEALKAGFGTFIGGILALAIKVAISITMIVAFYLKTTA